MKIITKKNAFVAITLLAFAAGCSVEEKKAENTSGNEVTANDNGEVLFSKVKKFVSLGEHRTGTTTDSLTAEWLKTELDSSGLKTEFVPFTLNQYFFESGKASVAGTEAEVFPLWPVNPSVKLESKGSIVDGDQLKKLSDVKGKLVLTRLKHVHGSNTPEYTKQINTFLQAGASAVLAVTENNTGEIVALNTYDDQKPWSAPVYLVAPKDTALYLKAVADKANVEVNVKGSSKNIVARDVVGRVGTGSKYVVISTPTSGWFATGGERGPGIAVWLGLAKWAKQSITKYPDYTFVFTGNAGHELSILGAKAFVEKAAPKPEDTKLWIHLGAGAAVKSWNESNGKWTLNDTVDSKRGIYYAASVAPSFEKSFAALKAKKIKGTEENKATVKPGGEGLLFQQKGYKNVVSISHSHRLHHVRSDDENTTSPKLLAELQSTLENFIQQELAVK